MSTTTKAPGRQAVFEGTGPVAARLGFSVEHLRNVARESGIYVQHSHGSPMYWTAELESKLIDYMVTRYRGSTPPTADEYDPFA